MISDYLPWIVGLFVAIATAWWLVLDYATKLRLQISDGRIALSKLRTEGVEIRSAGRNDGLGGKFTNDSQWLLWKTRADKWNQDVYEAIKKISVADAEWYYTLDIVDPPRVLFIQYNKDHADLFSWHDDRLKRLGIMIRDLRGRK